MYQNSNSPHQTGNENTPHDGQPSEAPPKAEVPQQESVKAAENLTDVPQPVKEEPIIADAMNLQSGVEPIEAIVEADGKEVLSAPAEEVEKVAVPETQAPKQEEKKKDGGKGGGTSFRTVKNTGK